MGVVHRNQIAIVVIDFKRHLNLREHFHFSQIISP